MTTIRPATTDDATAIARVHIAGWQSTYRGIMADDVLDGLCLEQRRAMWLDTLKAPSSVIFVAESRGDVIGFVGAGVNKGEQVGFAGEIYFLYVLKERHGQGIGKMLFQRAANSLADQNLNGLIDWTLSENPHRPFYEALGGKLVAEGRTNISGRELIQVAYGWKEWK